MNAFRKPRQSEDEAPPGPSRGFLTCQEIASAVGVSRRAIEMVEQRALRKIREEFARRGWDLADFTIEE